MTICVYGASSDLIDKSFIETTEELGRKMVERGHSLVYGAGAQGLMGAVARGVYEKNGTIVGVAPSFFNVDGVLFEDCTEMISTETMRQRKQIMEDRADCFIMTPGGIGTFEEFFEILTLKQLARHKKAIAVFNINGYYDSMEKMMQEAIDGKFMKPECSSLYKVFTDIDEMLDYLENYDDDLVDVTKMKNI
ncbi:MAG: TIGR00730 family Rossman fold protein [Clostridia bacterium]|nr:TIGR00730 family Rossman fold protein [Clostridia bacterium]